MLRRSIRRAGRWFGELSRPVPGTSNIALPLNGETLIEGISVDAAVKSLAEFVADERLALVLGTPDSGKSSMARRLAELAPTLGFASAKYYEGISNTFAAEFTADADEQRRKPENAAVSRLYVVDEAQEALAKISNFESAYMKNGPLCIVLVGTSAATKSDASPELLRDRKWWFHGPTVNRKDVEDYARRVLRTCDVNVEGEKMNRFVESLFDTCAGHIGVIMQALRFTVMKESFPSLNDLTSDSEWGESFTSRVICGSNGTKQSTWDGERKDIASELLAIGTHEVDWYKAPPTTKQLFRRGFFAPPRRHTSTSSEALVRLPTPALVRMTWAHSHQRHYAEHAQQVAAAKCTTKAEAAIDSAKHHPFDMLIGAASSIPVDLTVMNRLSDHTAKTDGTAAAEDHLDRAVTHALEKTFPRLGTFKPQTRTPEASEKALDLAFRFGGGGPQWGFEYTLNGAAIKKHMDYFDTGNERHVDTKLDSDQSSETKQTKKNYCCLNLEQWLVVDLCTKPQFDDDGKPKALPALVAKHPNFARVSPHPVVGWGAVVIARQGKTHVIPRDGVRRFLNAQGELEVATQLVPRVSSFYCRVSLPGVDNPVTTDVTATLRKEDLPRTVDGLKKAVLKEFPAKLKEKDVSDLTVYPPGKKKGAEALGDLDDIAATPKKDEPYHVVVA